ncbi:MAG TPA: hypothetical protein VN924_33065 [Bryobacteraceae bacterium]|nr:hypothetical protein [Bryobacteraceae bacterium]
MTHILFPQLRDLIQALNLCTESDSLFPESVLVASGKGWAIPESMLSGFDDMARRHAWAHRRVKAPPPDGEVQSFASVVGGSWVPLDPYRRRFNGAPRDAEIVVDPFEPNTEYIVAARTGEEAQSLLDALLSHTCGECRAVPLCVSAAAAAPKQPFQYFWSLSGNRPPDAALRMAPRAWWGPAGSSRNFDILMEWPYGLGVPDRVLQRIAWGSLQSVVLLSRSAPQTLILSAAGGGNPRIPLIETGDLRPARRTVIPVAAQTPPVRFRVNLRLAERHPKRPLRVRIRQLEREINERSLEIQRLQGDIDDDSGEFDPEPLFFYYSADESEVPDEIRRLLVEWTDQPGDLDCVQYQKLDATRFPKGLDQPYRVAHVVTTSMALGDEQKDPTIGFRLSAYVPQLGARTRFEQLRDWAKKGLRIMVPHARDLEVDPRFRPCPSSVEKLGAALSDNGHTANSLFVIVPNPDGGLLSFGIPVDGFRPIARAFDWDCQVEAAAAPSHVLDTLLPQAREALLTGLEGALDLAVREEGGRRLEARRNALRSELNSESARIQTRRQRLDQFHKDTHDAVASQELDTALRQLRESAAQLRETASLSSPEELSRSLARLQEVTAALSREMAELKRLEQAAAALERDMKFWK